MKRFQILWLILLMAVPLGAQVRLPGGWRQPDRIPSLDPRPLPWDLAAAAHLMRRAGFSAPLEELEEIVDRGFDASLEQLIEYQLIDDSEMEQALAERAYELTRVRDGERMQRVNSLQLQQWWMFRMLNSRRQLLEKMTFFWHDHFATSIREVPFVDADDMPLMLVQNETLREHALGNLKEMVHAVARDPAMIIWLNNFENVKGHPNENWARELLELFTMGEGNGYTEGDIQEAARAFTGWSLYAPRPGTRQAFKFRFRFEQHDEEPKTVLGETFQAPPRGAGIADGEEVIEIIFRQPQVADYITRKLWEYFVYPSPDDAVIAPLAELFRENDYELRPLMRAIFQHPHFLSDRAYRAKIKSPVEFVCGAYREMGISDPDNLPRLLLFFGLGQNLFVPPDVGGWTTDQGWINTGTVLGRSNFMTFLTSNRQGVFDRGEEDRFRNPAQDQIDLEGIIERNGLVFATHFVDFFTQAMMQGDLTPDTREVLERYLEIGDDGQPQPFDAGDETIVDKKVRGLIFLIGLLPAYQLN